MAESPQVIEVPAGDYYMPPPMMPQQFIRNDTETVKFRLNVEDLMVEMEHDLKGEHWVSKRVYNSIARRDETVEGWQKIGIAKVNDYGAKAIVGEIRIIVGKNSFLSDLEHNDIMMICRITGHSLCNLLEDKHNEFGLDPRDFETVVLGVCNLVFISLKRAEFGGERDAVSKNFSIQEVHHQGLQPSGKTSLWPFKR